MKRNSSDPSVVRQRYRRSVLYLTQGALSAALYVLFTWLSSLFGQASGAIQFRLSEGLIVLPLFFVGAVPGLTLGCFLANLLTGATVYDLIFGTLATLIGAIGARLLRRTHPVLAVLPNILANTIIVPLVILFSAGGEIAFSALPYLCLTVGAGEVVCGGVLAVALYYVLRRTVHFS